MKKNKPSFQELLQGIKNQDRTILAQAITLIESKNDDDRVNAQKLITEISKWNKKSLRLGISGTPGVGKSTFIDAFGKMLTAKNLSVAVLAIDPTSIITGGSILGDKTRMNELAIDPKAFIRPSPSGNNLGGVASRSRETILLCEAFGFDVILVETVGVGQSEVQVQGMVDLFLMLLQPGAGDDLQGIKRGILEVVDMVVVTKADGNQLQNAELAAHFYTQALQILRHDSSYYPKVFKVSSTEKLGLDLVWDEITAFKNSQSQLIIDRRASQLDRWFKENLLSALEQKLAQKQTDASFAKIQTELHHQKLSVYEATDLVLNLLKD